MGERRFDPNGDDSGRHSAAMEVVAPVAAAQKAQRIWLAGAIAGITVTIGVVLWFIGHFASAETLTGVRDDIKAVVTDQRSAEKREAGHEATLKYLKVEVRAQRRESAWTRNLLWRMAPRSVRDSLPEPPAEPREEPKENP